MEIRKVEIISLCLISFIIGAIAFSNKTTGFAYVMLFWGGYMSYFGLKILVSWIKMTVNKG